MKGTEIWLICISKTGAAQGVYESGGGCTQVDYILYTEITVTKVVLGESIARLHEC